MKNILVLCTGNSCRSQIAEGYLRFFVEGKANIYMVGVTVPVGAGAFLADYTKLTNKTALVTDANSQQYALGYTYNLSKRTNLYTSYSYTKNDKFAFVNVKDAGASDKLFNAGIRHSF